MCNVSTLEKRREDTGGSWRKALWELSSTFCMFSCLLVLFSPLPPWAPCYTAVSIFLRLTKLNCICRLALCCSAWGQLDALELRVSSGSYWELAKRWPLSCVAKGAAWSLVRSRTDVQGRSPRIKHGSPVRWFPFRCNCEPPSSSQETGLVRTIR